MTASAHMTRHDSSVSRPETEQKGDPMLTTTTRVFVTGLPPTLTRDQLASHFKTKYKVTDAHVVADRHIGFVGFHDHQTAQDAVKHFNRSYIRMSRISVELARPIDVKRDGKTQAAPISLKHNDTSTKSTGGKRKREELDDGEKERGQVPDLNGKQEQGGAMGTSAEATVGVEAVSADSDWLRGRTSRLLDLVDPEESIVQSQKGPSSESPRDQSQAAETSDPAHQIPEVSNARLFLRNLAFDVEEQTLREAFGPFGTVHEIHIVRDAKSSLPKGTAFIQFADADAASKALKATDGITLQGRLLHVLPASDKRDRGLTDFDISQLPLKKQKAIRRKQDAAKATFSWNSLYMNQDAVLSSIADRLGVSKADILDPTSSDAAVKQAHAETQLIKETKDYFASRGVDINAFKSRGRDSRTLILKNFSYGVTEAEFRAILDPFGPLTQLLLPPAGTMALVQYEKSYQATEALKNLSYKNIKGSVLYVEKAPQGIFDSQTSENVSNKQSGLDIDDEIATDRTMSTVFVKNLNFSTTDARLSEIASVLPGYVSARVKTRTDSKRPGEVLSMGFGFIEFATKQQALAAVSALSGHSLDGHALVVQLSSKATDLGEERRRQDVQKKKDSNQTKIVIKNLPFQASKKDIRALFSQYGQLKMVRVPRKSDNTARGFAFADFVSHKEAVSAIEALTNTHLLGRRLVLDLAEGDDIDPEEELRAIEQKIERQSNRTQFGKLAMSSRRKFNVNDDVSNDDARP